MSTKKQIGRIPISKGKYVAGQTYNRLSQVTLYGSTYQSMVDGNTSVPAILDENGNVQHANTDQWLVIADGREAYNAGEKLSCFSLQESEEHLAVETDAEGKILSSTNADGSHYAYKMKSETIDAKQDKEDGKGLIDKGVADAHASFDDIEGRMQITVDEDNKILSYRDENGVLHEPNIECANLIAKHLSYSLPCTCKEEVYLDRPRFAELHLNKFPPANDIDVHFIYNEVEVLHCKVNTAIQGHGSASVYKKGYTFDFINKTGDALSIKFGNMPSLDSYHCKAFYSDPTHSRALGFSSLWRNTINQLPYPLSKVNNKSFFNRVDDSKNNLFFSDARYREDGFPIAIYVKGYFFGLYTLKTKKSRENYAMDKNNTDEIFLDCAAPNTYLQNPFDYTHWEVKNPKMKGYTESGEIPNKEVLNNIERFFTFMNNLSSMKEQHKDYIVLEHWIVFMILSEVVGHWDCVGNNWNIMTWDGKHWSIIPYDLDSIMGFYYGGFNDTKEDGYVTNDEFWITMRSLYLSEIKEMYTKLRNSGFLDISNIMSYFQYQAECIPRYIYMYDLKLWGSGVRDELPTMMQMEKYVVSRLKFLDTKWLNN